ncbi:hypothetical protein RND81_05G045300 [Saponaria officinalis]|uniref:Uncharacterized protein n=1 Tax=Saponaria officinalis TaxID=3572 RepID=A0AAW1KUS8_SAPOF
MRMRMRILSSSSKPISSPGRTDKFPPPLMRFMKSDVSSRSRGRSRASPLFFRRKRSVNSTSTIETTQEPSSPKVTCIGQVRVRRSKNQSGNKPKPKLKLKIRERRNFDLCCWFRKPCLFLKCFRMPKWKWRWIFLFNCRDGRVRTAVSSSKNSGSARFEEGKEQRFEGQDQKQARHFQMPHFNEDEMYESGRRSSVSEMGTTSTAPPKNAFLLTRCRSSSLASRFWGEEEEEEEEADARECRKDGEEEDEEYERGRRSCVSEMGTSATLAPPKNAFLLTRSKSSTLTSRFQVEEEGEEIKKRGKNNELENEIMLLNNRDSTAETRGEGDSKFRGGEEIKKSVGVCAAEEEAVKKEEGKKDEGNLELVGTKALKLRRCKSEPARRDLDQFDPQTTEFWRLRRFSNAHSSAPHVAD